MEKSIIHRTEYEPLRSAFKQYLRSLGSHGFTWHPGYHYVDCRIHPKADAVLRHEDSTYHCGVCFWNDWIARH